VPELFFDDPSLALAYSSQRLADPAQYRDGASSFRSSSGAFRLRLSFPNGAANCACHCASISRTKRPYLGDVCIVNGRALLLS